MFLIILGIIVLVLGLIWGRTTGALARVAGIAKGIGTVLIVIGIIFSMVVQVEPGEVGVKKLFGKVDNDILESGLNFVNPMVDVVPFNIKTQNYTMSGQHDEGQQQGDDAMRVLTADGLEVVVDLTILFRVIPNKAPNILKEIGPDYLETIVRPVTRTKIRDNAVYYDAVSLYSIKRDEFQTRIFKSIEKNFSDRGLILEQILIRNITLPASVKAAIESKINAEQEAQKMQFVLLKEKQEAEKKRIEAQGIADYQKIISTGLNDKQLQYEMIKAISTSPNAKIIVMGDGKGMPLILDGK